MKKSVFFCGAWDAILSVITFSCESLSGILATPSLSMKGVGIKSLDLEGITFNVDYSITNPYPVAFTIDKLEGNLLQGSSTYAKIVTDKGISVAALGSKTNSVNFKIPYDKIISMAKGASSSSGTKSLPFTFDGNVSLNLSEALGAGQNLTLPFSKSFDVPVFKPSLSVSSPKVQLPTLTDLKSSLVNGGMNPVKAATVAASILAGRSLSADTFDGVDLNIDLNFDLNVANAGSAAWNFLINSCSLQDTAGKTLANVSPVGGNSINASSGKIPMKVSLNTLKSGSFIVQLLNKKGSNPTFVLDSGLSFPETSYAPNLPLKYTKEISLSSVNITR
ncbi:MAG: LEA type 2 family protein [Treponema sp.]|nr:LEA type 2 family protein [Treponema sp.]